MALTQAQKSARLIGGSSAGTILGINPYRSRYQEYLRMIGEEEEEDLSENINIYCGNLLEPVIAQILHDKGYEFKTGLEQEINPVHKHLSRNVDGLSADRKIVHEIKTANTFMRDKFADGPTPTYNAQINHYALWPEVEQMFLHVLFVPQEMKQMFFDVEFTADQVYNICLSLELQTFVCEPDVMLQEYMLGRYDEFMRFVDNRIPPPAQNMEELAVMFAQSESGSVQATDNDMRALTRIKEIKSEIKSLNDEAKMLQYQVCETMGEKDTLLNDGSKLATWKTQSAKRVDTQRLKDDKIYEKYLKVSESRVFRLAK